MILPRPPGQRTQLRSSRQHITFPLPRREKSRGSHSPGEPACLPPQVQFHPRVHGRGPDDSAADHARADHSRTDKRLHF